MQLVSVTLPRLNTPPPWASLNAKPLVELPLTVQLVSVAVPVLVYAAAAAAAEAAAGGGVAADGAVGHVAVLKLAYAAAAATVMGCRCRRRSCR